MKNEKPSPAKPETKVARLQQLMRDGLADGYIATLTGAHEQTIRLARARLLAGEPTFRWSAQRVEQFRALVEAGRSDVEVAEVMGLDPQAAGKRRYRMGLRGQRATSWTFDRLRAAHRLHDQGKSFVQIAGALGSTPEAVRKALVRRQPVRRLTSAALHLPTALLPFLLAAGLLEDEAVRILQGGVRAASPPAGCHATPEDIAVLARLANAGLTTLQMGQILGRSEPWIGAHRPPLTREQIRARERLGREVDRYFTRLVRKGFSDREIAALLDVDAGYVTGRRNTLGLLRRHQSRTAA